MRERKEEGDDAGVLHPVAGTASAGQVIGRLERGPKDAEEPGDHPPCRRQQQEAHVEGAGASAAGGVEDGGACVAEEAPRDIVVGVVRLLLLLLPVVVIAQPRVRQPGGAEERGESVGGPAVVVYVWRCV